MTDLPPEIVDAETAAPETGAVSSVFAAVRVLIKKRSPKYSQETGFVAALMVFLVTLLICALMLVGGDSRFFGQSPPAPPTAPVVGTSTFTPRPPPPEATTPQPVWLKSFKFSAPISKLLDPGIAGIVVAGSCGSELSTWQGIGIAQAATLWVLSETYSGTCQYMVGNGMLVLNLGSRLLTVDASTGQVVSSAELPAGETVYLLDDSHNKIYLKTGIILGTDSTTIHARKLNDLGKQLWQAAKLLDYSSVLRVFGDGKWVDAADGVLEMATGRRAGFGADVGYDDTTKRMTYYDGPDQNRVLRYSCRGSIYSGFTHCTFQLWDTKHDTGLQPAVTPADERKYSTLYFNDISQVFFAVAYGGDDSDQVAAYSWQTGQELWRAAMPIAADRCQLAGDTLFIQSIDRDDPGMIALDASTGRQVWWSPEMYYYDALMITDSVAYLELGKQDDSDVLTAFDTVEGRFALEWSINLPSDDAGIVFAGTAVVAFDDRTNELWVLDEQ